MARVIHFEIHADDPERAIQFYTNALGWSFMKIDGPMDYWLIQTGEREQPGIDGGLLRRCGEVGGLGANAYVCTVDVPDIDAHLEKVTAHGGTIALPKMPVPGVGWLAYTIDTEGNTFGAMQADPNAA